MISSLADIPFTNGPELTEFPWPRLLRQHTTGCNDKGQMCRDPNGALLGRSEFRPYFTHAKTMDLEDETWEFEDEQWIKVDDYREKWMNDNEILNIVLVNKENGS